MKTDDLIALLARDATPVSRRGLPLRLAALTALGALAAFFILAPWLGVRDDMAEALVGPVFWMKAIYTGGLGVAGFALVERLSRPGAKGRLGWALIGLFAVVILILAVMQISTTSPEGMRDAIMGTTWDRCPWRILVLAVPGLLALIWAMRGFAPTRPMLAGGAAGLLAGGVAATVYGLHCQETAAPFVALWYTLGVALSVGAGALIGARALRW